MHACTQVFIELLPVSGTVLGTWDPSPNKGQANVPVLLELML